ncbi:MAG: HAMP domain-containing protein, partial [Atopobiaceae bacterium]|nr:HAMP domain-containing protein [Atopobiaceae bacterium]
RDWKGALHDEPRLVKIQMFVMFLVLAVSLTFIQFGFIGIGTDGQYVGYAMGLLLPISATAFLLGKGAGALQGVLSGAMLLFHATFQPLNLVERYFVSWLNSIVLFSFAGFIIGLFLAVALRNNPTGRRRTAYIAVASLLASLVVTVAFLINVIINYIMQSVQIYLQTNRTDVLSKQLIGALNGMGSMSVQIGLDFMLICGVVLLLDYYMRHFYKKKSSLSVRTSFGIELFVVVLLVFSVLTALSYVFITQQVSREVFDDMSNDAKRLGEQLKESDERIERILDSGVVETMSDETFGDVVNASYMDSIISAYDLSRDGTVMVMFEEFILYSNNPAFPPGRTASEVFGDIDSTLIKDLESTDGFHEILYDTKPYEEGAESTAYNASSTAELGYLHVSTQGDYRIFIVMPFSRIFESRQVMMGWSGMLSFILLGVVYVLTSRLLARDVVNPIDRTNESLARITGGDLDVMIEEEGNVEFTSLSSGINTTVGALKGYIHETEVRMERELATAKAIQSSAIPRVFPPFPEVDKFDIFASMDAAKEVGGDFYDFFLIDDHTLGFLIADVSGKGIP